MNVIERISAKILAFLISKNAVNKNYDIYNYGIKIIISESINILSIIFISILFGNILIGIEYVIVFGIFRIIMGGYHAPTVFTCYLGTCTLFVSAEVILKSFPQTMYSILTILFFASNIVIWILSPVDTSKHRMSRNRIEKNSNTSKLICLLMFFLFVLEKHFHSIYLEIVLIVSIYIGSLLLIQYFINCKERRNCDE